MKNYKISEIFYSIQGEGSQAGTPSIFIRFFGCNLDCSFCDEPLHKTFKSNYSYTELLNEISKYPSKHITISGGEPSLYNLNPLITKLKKLGYFISIETNGYRLDNIKEANLVVCSPKNGIIYNNLISEYKIIVKEGDSISRYLTMKCPIYIQPMADKEILNMKNTEYCINLVKRYPKLKLSLQTHKYIGVQ